MYQDKDSMESPKNKAIDLFQVQRMGMYES